MILADALFANPSAMRGRGLGQGLRPFYVSIAVRNPEFRDQFANGCTEGRPMVSLHVGEHGGGNGQGVGQVAQGEDHVVTH